MNIEELKENLKIDLDTYLTDVVSFYLNDYRDDFSIEEFFKAFKEVFGTWADINLKNKLIDDREEN